MSIDRRTYSARGMPLAGAPPHGAHGAADSALRWAGLRSPLALALFAAALSLGFSLPTLDMLPFWGDEVLTLRSIALPVDKLIDERFGNAHSPAYFLAIKALGLSGQSAFLVRLPSALAVAFAAACTSLYAYRLGGWRAALALAFAFATVPALLTEAQDARPNSWQFAFLALFTLSLARLLDHPRSARAALARGGRPAERRLRWAWAGAVCGGLGTMALLPLGLLAVAAGDAAVLWAARSREVRPLLGPWFALRLLTLLLLVPMFVGLATGFESRVGHYWPPAFSWEAIRTALKVSHGAGIDFLDPNEFLIQEGNRLLYWGLFACVALGAVLARRRRSFTLLLFMAFLPPAVLIGLSLHTSLLVGRYFAVATPAALTLAALGVAVSWSRWPLLTTLPALGLAVLLILQSLDAMHQLGKPRFDLAMARLHAAGVEELLVSLPYHYRQSTMYPRANSPVLVRLKPLQAVVEAKRGRMLWVISRSDRKIRRIWHTIAERSESQHCTPVIPGLNLLVITRDAELLSLSCPGQDKQR